MTICSTPFVIREIQIKTTMRDFPVCPVVENLSCNAGDAGLIPGQGIKIPRAAGQLSPRAATREKPTHCNKEPVRCN